MRSFPLPVVPVVLTTLLLAAASQAASAKSRGDSEDPVVKASRSALAKAKRAAEKHARRLDYGNAGTAIAAYLDEFGAVKSVASDVAEARRGREWYVDLDEVYRRARAAPGAESPAYVRALLNGVKGYRASKEAQRAAFDALLATDAELQAIVGRLGKVTLRVVAAEGGGADAPALRRVEDGLKVGLDELGVSVGTGGWVLTQEVGVAVQTRSLMGTAMMSIRATGNFRAVDATGTTRTAAATSGVGAHIDLATGRLKACSALADKTMQHLIEYFLRERGGLLEE